MNTHIPKMHNVLIFILHILLIFLIFMLPFLLIFLIFILFNTSVFFLFPKTENMVIVQTMYVPNRIGFRFPRELIELSEIVQIHQIELQEPVH